jgi:hypothetical protein
MVKILFCLLVKFNERKNRNLCRVAHVVCLDGEGGEGGEEEGGGELHQGVIQQGQHLQGHYSITAFRGLTRITQPMHKLKVNPKTS